MTMGVGDSWLGKDPSTALEDGHISAKMSAQVCVC